MAGLRDYRMQTVDKNLDRVKRRKKNLGFRSPSSFLFEKIVDAAHNELFLSFVHLQAKW